MALDLDEIGDGVVSRTYGTSYCDPAYPTSTEADGPIIDEKSTRGMES